MKTKIAEYAYDLQSGISTFSIPDFDDLTKVGMAATLAIHIKGLGEIKYEVLRGVSEHFMGIPSHSLESVVRILAEISFVILTENGRKIEKILPTIPVFEQVYGTISSFANSELSFNSQEQAILEILSALENAPRNKDNLFNNLGIEKPLFDRTLLIGSKSGIVSEHLARGRSIVVSPLYFADNLDGLADAAAAVSASALQSTLRKVRDNQGWPLSMVKATGEIGGVKLDAAEQALVDKLSSEGVMKPPTIAFGAKTESFVFTPKPGSARLNAANREVYERAMALVSAVRKGQLLPNEYAIRSPVRILESLREKGYLRSNSEAPTQYLNLVYLKVGTLQPGPNGHQFHLTKTPENTAALNLAIQLLRSGSLAGMEVDQNARIALGQDEKYIQSLISARQIKERAKPIENEQAIHEFEQLLLRFD
ncbi:hypothetical protein [Rhizobium chutanense]|uniref:Uncharacterized protein n=1 Tax=Rhizobium chutanense TaxID=2035448 RepID=A0A3S0QG37_9HYPH|nr:hypothetical protein [Rhizobium chutanense]RUM05183.1 hypothetical protein EFR84_17255 [Rhizobium chutanense]